MTADQSAISSWRVYWDQGSLLRQIGLLPLDPSRIQLNKQRPAHAQIIPVLNGHQISTRFLDDRATRPNPLLEQLGENVHQYGSHSKNSGNDTMGSIISGRSSVSGDVSGLAEGGRPSTKVNSKYVGGKSSEIFSPATQTDVQNSLPKVHVDPRRYESHFSLGQDLSENTLLAQTTRLEGSDDMKMGNHISRDGRTNKSHFSFEHDQTPHLEVLHAGKKMYNQSHLSTGFFNADDEEEKIIAAAASKLTLQTQQKPPSIWESSSNGLGAVQSRPSSRFSFYFDIQCVSISVLITCLSVFLEF